MGERSISDLQAIVSQKISSQHREYHKKKPRKT